MRRDAASIQTWEDAIDLPGPEDGGDFSWRTAFDGLTLFMDGGALRGGRLLTGPDGKAEALQLCDLALADAGTAEARNVQALEEELATLERDLEDYEANNKWLISPGKLAWVRAHGDRACVKAPGWFEKDTSGEAWQLSEQYDAGLIPARAFLADVSQKARMMALEGE